MSARTVPPLRRSSAPLAVAVLLAVLAAALAAAPAAAAHPSSPQIVPHVSVHFTIPLGKDPSAYAYDPSNFDIYAANQHSNNVTVVSSVTHTHSSIPVGKGPIAIVYDPTNKEVYTANYNSSNVTIISTSTNKVVHNVALSAKSTPLSMFVDPANGAVLVLNRSTTTGHTALWAINASTNAVKKLLLGAGTIGYFAYSPKNHDVYLANEFSANVSVISKTLAVSKVTLAGYPFEPFFDPATNQTLVSTLGLVASTSPKIYSIGSTNAITATLSATKVAALLFAGYDPHVKDVYFVGENSTGFKFYAVAVGPATTIVGSVLLGTGSGAGFGIPSYDPADLQMYFPSQSGNITVVSGTTVTAKIHPAHTQPFINLVYDPTLKDMVGVGYVNATTTSTAFFFANGVYTGASATLAVGKHALGVFYDPKDTYVYVANVNQDLARAIG